MKLNLGCGNRKDIGWINVDKMAACIPDQMVDLESLPWPWPDNSASEIKLSHVLEHLGAATETYLGIIKELYRVCRNGAVIHIAVPHPRHDNFLGDPTHVRAIIPDGLMLFSQAENRLRIAQGAANTPLGIYLGVDFHVEVTGLDLDEPWRTRLQRNEISVDELTHAANCYNNVIQTINVKMRAIK